MWYVVASRTFYRRREGLHLSQRSGKTSTAHTPGLEIAGSSPWQDAERGGRPSNGEKGWPQVRNLSVLMTRAAMGILYGKCFGGSCVRELSRAGKQVLEGGFRLNAISRGAMGAGDGTPACLTNGAVGGGLERVVSLCRGC
jgi:hypothetical protein